MLRNYLTVAVRNLLRHKGYSAINIAGLAVGMACCILITLYIRDELSYDRYHEKANRIFRVTEEYKNDATGEKMHAAMTAFKLTPALLNAFPEIVHITRFYRGTLLARYGRKQFLEGGFALTDATVFKIFSLPLIKGDPETALTRPNTVVITEETARKYFGDEEPVGKVLTSNGEIPDLEITGVMQKIPQNSHFRFDLLASMETLKTLSSKAASDWRRSQFTYLLLPENYPPDALARKLPDFVEKCRNEGATFSKLHLQPLTDIHLYSNLREEMGPNSSIEFIFAISVIAFLILFIACANFMNLSTARSAIRAREIGVRKVVGAHRLQIVTQFLGESIFLSCMALFLAVAMVELSMPLFNILLDKKLSVGLLDHPFVVIGVTLFAGIIAGSYPAFFLSALQPVNVLKGISKATSRSFTCRKVLVVIQFSISIGLIVCTGIMYSQLSYLKNKQLGFNKEDVVVIDWAHRIARIEPFKSELLKNVDILSVSASKNVPPDPSVRSFVVNPEEVGHRDMKIVMVDYDFMRTLGIELKAGRDFSRDWPTDAEESVILNEEAVKELGWASSVGKRFDIPYFQKRSRVIGVVKNFNFESLYQKISPVAFIITPRWYSKLTVRVRSNNISDTVDFLKKKWQEFVPDHPFSFYFLDDRLDQLYRAEEQRGQMVGTFSTLAIFVACLGLFGLASFTVEQRTKEIGIRKVLGASVSSIVMLLSREFLLLVGVANLIAWPVAYCAMNRWLRDFAYRIELGPGAFVLGGVLALGIALLTVSAQAVKAATANPVDALRYE
ncbi:MAG: hypothetical protein A3F84_17065 [Candidatus Handelsmanbacteria bacterium RIFCSPLOWO2_12_FULL_64_10]|uniref:ABC transporter permease n=1 Tax=Handelsmanbacteria sp. (strain RIFCSPLOWO2_12_FULL_64_10) TaxID=1817868 RepID=A0A1F6C9Q3_HANXR|nr:MAG: hypothetical protein A3F84_17065 [Candidatus Handelsmanbacteria bacterium RIFCSPLOWO2_12_FULL_64_10]